jgi:Ribonuclease G/E
MDKDRAKHTILPMSKFGLVQITRERVRPALEIATSELCSSCLGTGRSDSSVQLLGKIENEILYLWEQMNQKSKQGSKNKASALCGVIAQFGYAIGAYFQSGKSLSQRIFI